MVFTYERCMITGLFHDLRQGVLSVIQGCKLIYPVFVGIFSSHDCCPAWRTDGIRHKAIFEKHSSGGNPVNIRSSAHAGKHTPISTDGLGSMVVRHNKKNVGQIN